MEGVQFQSVPGEEFSKYLGETEDLYWMSETRWFAQEFPRELLFEIRDTHQGGVTKIGWVGLKTIRWVNRKAQVNLVILPEYRGKKWGKRSLEGIAHHAFQNLGFHRLEAETLATNAPALAMMRSAGFLQEGLLRQAKFYQGSFVDIVFFGLLKSDWSRFHSHTPEK